MVIQNSLWVIDGMPPHPLIIHLTVVTVPLAVAMVIASLVWKRFRKYDLLTLAVLIIASVSAFLTSLSGKNLSDSIGVTLEHSTWGFYVPVTSTVATVFFGLMMWARKQTVQSSLAKITKGFFVVILVISISATLALTFLAGHSGSQLVWEPKISGFISEN